MAKRRRSRSRRVSRGGCCPLKIQLKCKLKRTAAQATVTGPSLAERLAKFKQAERDAWHAKMGGLGAYTPRGYFPNAPNRGAKAAKAARAAKHAGYCTVKFGGKSKRLNPVSANAYIRSIISKQRSKGCLPPVVSKG